VKIGTRRAVYIGLVVIALFLGLNALVAPLVYYAKPIHGRVIDAQTRRPVQGAIIGALWVLQMWGIGERDSIREAQTVTDLDGNYAIPGAVMLRWPPVGWLDFSDPAMVVFKSGYEAEFLSNGLDRNGWVRRSQWDGSEIELNPFRGTPQARLNELYLVLRYCGRSRSCYGELNEERPFCGARDPSFFEHIERLMNEVK
jgi:hypothetical protein